MEQGLVETGFESLDILQPSLLLGWRGETRPLELAAHAFMPLVNPLLRGRYIPYRAIPARTVGEAMLGAIRSGRRGVQRSEEHTSELQSQSNLVCRLLLEKKKPCRSGDETADGRT